VIVTWTGIAAIGSVAVYLVVCGAIAVCDCATTLWDLWRGRKRRNA
jgi:hypothetical protein